jgi:hypothetical protein
LRPKNAGNNSKHLEASKGRCRSRQNSNIGLNYRSGTHTIFFEQTESLKFHIRVLNFLKFWTVYFGGKRVIFRLSSQLEVSVFLCNLVFLITGRAKNLQFLEENFSCRNKMP